MAASLSMFAWAARGVIRSLRTIQPLVTAGRAKSSSTRGMTSSALRLFFRALRGRRCPMS
jgi:Na+/H+ antiporter NhaC